MSCDPSGTCTTAGNYGGEDYTAVTGPDGTLGSAQPLVKGGVNDFGTAFLDCVQPGYCTVVDTQTAGTLLVLTEGTASTLTLQASGATTYGSEQDQVLTASVTSPAGGTPTGTVTVTDGSTPVCTINLADSEGTCSPSATALPVGIDTLTATYSGDATYVPATSTATLTVDPQPTPAYTPVAPVRILDTRNGTGGFHSPVGAEKDIALQVTGLDGVPVTGVSAVVLNLTATDPTASGWVVAYPDGTTRPAQGSNLDFTKGETIPNLVIVPVGADGKIDLYNTAGTVNLVADLQGYYTG